MKITSRRWWLASIAAAAVAVSAVLATVASAGAGATSSQPGGLGQSSGLLPRDHLTLESAIQVNLSKETVRLPLYPGTANGKKVWYVLLDASDPGLAHDLGVNYAPKLANIAISDPAAVQTVTLGSPMPQANPFGPGVVHFAGVTQWTPTGKQTNGVRLVQIHPKAAAKAGVRDGDAVVVESPRGAVTGTALVWPDMREDVIFVPTTFGPMQKLEQ